VGTLVGGVVGAVAGGLAGEGLAEAINPSVEDDYWRRNYTSRPYVVAGARYDTYRRAYEYGWQAYQKNPTRTFEEMEPQLREEWGRGGPEGLTWDDAKDAVRDAWHRVERR
jgi:hypothetical protein